MTFTSRRKFPACVSLFRDHMDVAQRGVNVLYQKTHLKIRQCALDKCPTVHHYVTEMCTRVCYKMVHCEVWDWCIVGFVQQVWNSCSKIYPINFHTGRALFWCSLTHCHLEKMAEILRMTFVIAFSSSIQISIKFLSEAQLTISQHWFRYWNGA